MPKTAFSTAAASDAPKVRRYVASAMSAVASFQNSAHVMCVATRSDNAPMGISTSRAR